MSPLHPTPPEGGALGAPDPPSVRAIVTGPVSLLLLLTLTGYATLYVVPGLSRARLAFFVDYYAMLPLLAISLLAVGQGVYRLDSTVERRFWQLVSVGVLAWLGGNVLWAIFPVSIPQLVDVTIDLLYVCFYLCLLWALDQKPHMVDSPARRVSHSRYTAAGTAVFGLALAVYFVLIPLNINQQTWLFSYLLYLILDVAVVARLVYLVRQSAGTRWGRLYGGLLVGSTLITLTDTLECLEVANLIDLESGGLVDLLYYATPVAYVWTARVRDLTKPVVSTEAPLIQADGLIDRIGRVPGALIGYAFALPAVHTIGYTTDVFNAASRDLRSVTAFASAGIIFLLAIRERIALEQANRRLHAQVRQAAEQLQQAQKVQALGRLAGGIAHDFNNLLLIIRGYAELLGASVPPDSDAAESARQIEAAADRATALTRQLLAFSRRQLLQPTVLDLNQTVRKMEDMLRRLFAEPVAFRIELHDQPVVTKADPVQIEQVLLNLVINARDAMSQGGTLAIRTSIIQGKRPGIADQADLERFVVLTVRDTGTGIPSDVLPLIFEPFFTTKGTGGGTGLGLSMVQGIVEQSGGFVEVDTVLNQGSEFRVLLPHSGEPLPAVEPAPEKIASATREIKGTALVIEDEPPVRTLVAQVLRGQGLTVLESESSPQAVELSRLHDALDVVVADVMMPQMTGPDAVREISRHHPAIKVLYITGYPSSVLADRGVTPESATFLQKPFSADSLISAVRGLFPQA